jgi:hypothetical protein
MEPELRWLAAAKAVVLGGAFWASRRIVGEGNCIVAGVDQPAQCSGWWIAAIEGRVAFCGIGSGPARGD